MDIIENPEKRNRYKIMAIKRIESNYTWDKITKKYQKGSRVGLEGVYDKIYQRLLKQKRVILAQGLLDSLKEQSSVFINSNYQ